MSGNIPERDWKYMRGIKDELLAKLCARINDGSVKILQDESLTQHERYLKNYKYIKKSDYKIADCFNDWRRSRLTLNLLCIYREKLMTDEQLSNLTEDTQEHLKLIR